jgi:hypothetical protein
MSLCVISSIALEPYSTERLVVVCGYNCDVAIEWLESSYEGPEVKTLLDIKKYNEGKKEWVDFFNDNREDFDGLDKDGDGVGAGVYIYRAVKNKDYKLRLLILKYGFSPSNPENMRTLAHEVLHLCQEFLPSFLNRDEEMEAEAYFHSYIMQQCYKLFL